MEQFQCPVLLDEVCNFSLADVDLGIDILEVDPPDKLNYSSKDAFFTNIMILSIGTKLKTPRRSSLICEECLLAP